MKNEDINLYEIIIDEELAWTDTCGYFEAERKFEELCKRRNNTAGLTFVTLYEGPDGECMVKEEECGFVGEA